MEQDFKPGDKVKWEYTHDLKRFRGTKHGEFVGLIKHGMRFTGTQLAGVCFIGNKRMSQVPLRELKKDKLP